MKKLHNVSFNFLGLLILGLVTGCASTPVFDTQQVDRNLTPQLAVAEPELAGSIVLWGGTILDTRNLKNNTQIEVLAYPLNTSQRPVLNQKPLGRFILQHKGFLEPSIYAVGRWLSVKGKLLNNQSGTIGERLYTYPVIQAQQIQLWPQPYDTRRGRFHFGIGIGIQR